VVQIRMSLTRTRKLMGSDETDGRRQLGCSLRSREPRCLAVEAAICTSTRRTLKIPEIPKEHLFCPANLVSVGMRQTGMRGAWNSTRKKHSPAQIVSLLRQSEVAVANGKTTGLARKEASITEQTYYRRRKEVWRAASGPGSATEGA
jgi:hypothetical protein